MGVRWRGATRTLRLPQNNGWRAVAYVFCCLWRKKKTVLAAINAGAEQYL